VSAFTPIPQVSQYERSVAFTAAPIVVIEVKAGFDGCPA
jgi:hypothetical protein